MWKTQKGLSVDDKDGSLQVRNGLFSPCPLTVVGPEQTERPPDDTPNQSGLSPGLASFYNNDLSLATHNRMGKHLRKESHRNFTRNVHISHWKQLGEPQIPPPRGEFVSKLSMQFSYSNELGWDNSKYPFIPPMHGDDPRGSEFPREAPFGQFLNQFTGFTARLVRLLGEPGRVWLPQHNTPIDGRRKPDLVLVDSQHQTAAGNKWEHLRSICQVKYKDTPDLVEAAYEQLYDNAFFIFTKQDSRLFFIGFSICGATLRAYLFHRGGTMESTPMSFHTQPWAVAQALLAIAHTKLTNIGYDPTIATPVALTPMVPAPILISNPWDRDIETAVKHEGGRYPINLIIDTCLFSSHSVQGRGTHVFACLHPQYLIYLRNISKVHEEGSNQKGKGKAKGMAEVEPGYQGLTHCIVKDCWVDNASRSDHHIHTILKQRNPEMKDGALVNVEPKGIAVYLLDHINKVSSKEEDDENSSYIDTDILPDVKMRKMIHKRFVFETCGVGIQWFATIKEFTHVILGAVEGHKNALDLDILHRDISGPNVMIAVNKITKECAIPNDQGIRDGFLADWGLAIDLREKELQSSDSVLHTRTGTYPYLSTELMFGADGHTVKHRACDDLESFFWILWVMSVNCTGPFNQTRDWESIERLMITLAAEQSKTMVYMQGSGSKEKKNTQIPEDEERVMGTAPTWMTGVLSRAPTTSAMTQLPAPPRSLPTLKGPTEASQPLPTSTSTSASPDVSIAQRLRVGLQAQREHMKEVWKTQLAVDKAKRLYRVGEFASVNVPAWAKPGGHTMEYRQVAMDKATLSWDMMKAFITPYFAVTPFLNGMEKLHNLFKGTTSTREGVVVWSPPMKAPTHQDVMNILKEILDGLTQELDPYPTAAQIKDGRERYESFLQDGRFPEFPQIGKAPPLTKAPPRRKSGKASGSTLASISDCYMMGTGITASSGGTGMNLNKRGVESLGPVEDGSPTKMNRKE